MPDRQLELSAGPVEGTGGLGEIANGMRRLVLGERHRGEPIQRISCRGQGARARDDDAAPLLHHGGQAPVAPLADRGGHLAHVDRRRAGIPDQVHALDAVEEGENAGPRLRRPNVMAAELRILEQPRGANARLLGATGAGFGHARGGRETLDGQPPPKRGQIRGMHGR